MSKIRVALIVPLVAACNDPATKDAVEPPCYEVPDEKCPDTGETGAEMVETGDDETGEGGPKMLGPGECVFNPDENKIGLQYN